MKPDENRIIVKDKRDNKKNTKLIAKLLHLPVGQKACLLILFMGVLGALIGRISAEMEIRGCTPQEQCLIVDTTQKRLDGTGKGAFAGIGTAVFSSLPALLERLRH